MQKEKLNKNSENFVMCQDNYIKAFKANVEIYAKENNLTIRKISELSDISFATLNSFLYGDTRDCKLSTAIKLAKAFGVSLDELTGAGTISESSRKSLNAVRQFPNRTRYLIKWFIKYHQKLLSENKRKKIISVLFSDDRGNSDMDQCHQYASVDITSCSKEIKSKVFVGIKITNENYMPQYMPGDILLIANDHCKDKLDNYAISYYERIYIVRKKVSGKEIQYYSINNSFETLSSNEIDAEIGYIVKVLHEEDAIIL